jgi:hypothetical protein
MFFSIADIYPSDFMEWQPLGCLTGTFLAFHSLIGHLTYKDYNAARLVREGVFFYDHLYKVPLRGKFGSLEEISIPPFSSVEWPQPDLETVEACRLKIVKDIEQCMKFTFGSRRVYMSLAMPMHVFAKAFQSTSIHHTKTMWVCKDIPCSVLDDFLQIGWDLREGNHNGDIIRCQVVNEHTVLRYHISKGTLSISFIYRRWKYRQGKWEPLESDTEIMEQHEVALHTDDGEVYHVNVWEGWTLRNVRETIELMFQHINKDFHFLLDGKMVAF